MVNIKLISISLFILSCFSQPKPDWLTSYPKAENYWYGIGRVDKPYNGKNIREEARSQAFNEIGSQIKVDISASFTKVVVENNLKLDEVTNSILKTSIENSLDNIEILDTYEDKQVFIMLTKLSKQTYYDNIKKQRSNAIQSALDLITMAESIFNVNSFNLLNQAMNLLLPYFDSPIIVEYPISSGKTVNLYSYLNLLASTLYSQIKILPENKSINLKLGFRKDGHLKVKIVDMKNNPLSNIPIACYVDNKNDIIRTFSDSEGHSIFPIPKINNEKIQTAYYFIDLDSLFRDAHFFSDIVLNRAQTKLNIIFPKIDLQIIEKHLGFKAENPFIEPILMKFFNQKMKATFVKDEPSDLVVKGQVNTNKISDGPITLYGTNIYQVTADFNITILDSKTTNQIISKSYNIQKEIDYFSFDEASNNALKKISSQIQNEFLPELGEIILKN